MIEVQELKNKEDIEALSEGDKVWIDLEGYEGRITFLCNEQGTLSFIRRHKGKILEYMIEETNIDVQDNYITQKHHWFERNKPLIHTKDDSQQYEIYNEIIGEK